MMKRKVSSLEDQLRLDEGEVLHAYTDSKGYLTIGIGVLIDKRKGGGITKEESTYLFHNRMTAKNRELMARFPWMAKLDEVRRAVFLNMAFQMGVEGVAGFKNALKAASVGNYTQAAVEMLDSKWAREDSPERAERLATQMSSGVWQ
ncbi:hypothetical protein [Pseudomonas phage KP1]|uniref:Lysozyme n=1 Tax=Pseudomonas phage KP1 TaxID=2562463 RepID=A0A6G5QAI7_9CAUD|nr:baseplate hub subunit and tail lysozyme [Pseudomonas phage KP1]QBZ71748.1 hypothetical protein [Pseudomonas phage KP1]